MNVLDAHVNFFGGWEEFVWFFISTTEEYKAQTSFSPSLHSKTDLSHLLIKFRTSFILYF